ncbi:anthranilate synthase component 1 [Corynebacterium sp. 153RC1]|uniref:anthranilate synthase component 1 n=1 Tax=unclassified Corynebacterium TaxID=2624378 RepID=UPI00211C2A21|nr:MULTISPECIES: anthranilate synthase component 1 [unclassified Corynebacterium]MCQ9352781.1 anthranilate synthase component 1 [Corynebacterium sp. 209RC1]MCQ9354965.1 anthranilate synthase component 1 [Corynebacterium sp. 1222RC1]MCQ9357226.1 anthranilate synthase component 1 [Corynebacterium sp. 122RC1]MCQ9359401.1 anthranilate synthase component 1 [Corynebacterium sp. 142RC1]MCQ9361623.1 anthranilate synthase component 1 [Corynebacterium sp. 153RC1]
MSSPPNDFSMFHVKHSVRYHQDAAALFQHLAAPHDSVLLESADIESKKNTKCLAVLKAAARITCHGQKVKVIPLTEAGEQIVSRLKQNLADYFDGQDFVFTASQAIDERERLKAPSNALVLRDLQLNAGYQGTHLPLLAGGFAFDYLETFETLPPVELGANTYPDYEFVLAETVLVIDHTAGTAEIETIGGDVDTLLQAIEDFEAPAQQPAPESGELIVQATTTDADFRDQVKRLQGNIYEGDIYQVVPARSFIAECPDAYQAYRQLRATNPSPYMFYVRGKDYELFGASPESNLKYSSADREVQLYPIAGTRPRGLNADGTINHELDIRAELDMRTDTKEVAEHTMLVDLARNDLARVAVPATRKVADLLQVDRYSRVMHLVSRVTATLAPEFDALDAYRACMNMGTLTGAPKLRAMELLRGVEHVRRGSYGGAVGYLSGDGSMDNCIVIRSAFVAGGRAVVQAGAGVVRDSQPQSEADETLHKAYAVLHAIALAAGKTVKVIR